MKKNKRLPPKELESLIKKSVEVCVYCECLSRYTRVYKKDLRERIDHLPITRDMVMLSKLNILYIG